MPVWVATVTIVGKKSRNGHSKRWPGAASFGLCLKEDSLKWQKIHVNFKVLAFAIIVLNVEKVIQPITMYPSFSQRN